MHNTILRLKILTVLALCTLFIVTCTLSIDPSIETAPQNDTDVINGQEALHKEFPTIVALTRNNGKSEFCSGTLLKADLVLTAAHCIESMSLKHSHVVYGHENILNCDKNCILSMHSARAHPDYVKNNDVWYDIALILLEDKIPNATTAKLLPYDDYIPLLDDNSVVTIAGYGRAYTPGPPQPPPPPKFTIRLDPKLGIRFIQLNASYTSGVLFSAEVPIISRNDYEIHVGEDDPTAPNACYGDSGGPIYVNNNGITYVTGVASRIPPNKPIECGHGVLYSLPGLYVDWIEKTYVELTDEKDARPPPPVGTGGSPAIPVPPPPKNNEEEKPVILSPTSTCTYGIAKRAPRERNISLTFITLLGFLVTRRRITYVATKDSYDKVVKNS